MTDPTRSPDCSATKTVPVISPRCGRCRRKLAEVLTPPWRLKCNRCGMVNEVVDSGPDPGQVSQR